MKPRKISILGEDVFIREYTEKQFADFVTEKEEILGLAILLEGVIAIKKDIPEKYKKHVLAHEIFHFALFQSGVSQSITPEIEEVLCQTFSKLYHQLKTQNI